MEEEKINRKLEIAKLIAFKTFNIKNEHTSLPSITNEINKLKGVGTKEIIQNKKYEFIYTMNKEREYLTHYNLNKINNEMLKISKYNKVSVKSLINCLRDGLKVYFIFLSFFLTFFLTLPFIHYLFILFFFNFNLSLTLPFIHLLIHSFNIFYFIRLLYMVVKLILE